MIGYRQHSDQRQSGSSRLNKATWFNGAISHWCLCVLKFWYQVQRVRNLETSDEVCTRWCDSVSLQTGQLRKDGKDKVKVRSCCAQLFEHRLHINSCQNVVVAYCPSLTLSGSSFKTNVFQLLEFQKCGRREPLRESWGLVYIKMFGYPYTVVFLMQNITRKTAEVCNLYGICIYLTNKLTDRQL